MDENRRPDFPYLAANSQAICLIGGLFLTKKTPSHGRRLKNTNILSLMLCFLGANLGTNWDTRPLVEVLRPARQFVVPNNRSLKPPQRAHWSPCLHIR